MAMAAPTAALDTPRPVNATPAIDTVSLADTPTAPGTPPQPSLDASSSSDTPPLPTDTATAPTAAARGFWVQLGAFKQSAGAMDFKRKAERELEGLAPLLAVFTDRSTHRLQAGPYRSRADAVSAAERIRTVLRLVPVIVERR